MLVADGKVLGMYQGDKLLVVADAGVHQKWLTKCHLWMRIAAKPGLEPAS